MAVIHVLCYELKCLRSTPGRCECNLGLCRCNQVKVRWCWTRISPNPMTSVLIRSLDPGPRRDRGHETTAVDWGRQLQSQGAQGLLATPDAGKASMSPLSLWGSTYSLQKYEGTNFCCVKSPSLSSLVAAAPGNRCWQSIPPSRGLGANLVPCFSLLEPLLRERETRSCCRQDLAQRHENSWVAQTQLHSSAFQGPELLLTPHLCWLRPAFHPQTTRWVHGWARK